MNRSIAHAVTPDQLVPGVRVHVVLVAIETLAVLLGPARVLVLLPVSRGFLCPRLRRLASLHRFVLLFGVAVLRDRHSAALGMVHHAERSASPAEYAGSIPAARSNEINDL